MSDISKRKISQAERKRLAAEASEKAIGGNGYTPPGGSPVGRLSPSRVTGQQAASSGDHNAAAFADPMNQPGPRQQAYEHRDLREQSSTSVMPLLSAVVSGSSSEHAPEHNIVGLYADARVDIDQISVPDLGGLESQLGGNAPSGNPHVRDYSDHMARNSPVAPNGSHSLASPQSNAVAMKSSEAREALKRPLFPGSGAR